MAAAVSAGFSASRLARVTGLLEGVVDRGEMAGVGARIWRRGAVVLDEYRGYADIAARRPLAADTLLQFASMTKPVTAVAMMTLYEEGLFDLETPVHAFIPRFKDLRVLRSVNQDGTLDLVPLQRPVTMRHLFTHGAGLSYGWDTGDAVDRAYQDVLARPGVKDSATLADLPGLLCDLPLAYQPGSAYRYSLATDLLGALVEILSGMPYARFLRERIFEPLGMVDAGFHVPPEKASRAATVYDRRGGDGKLRPAPDTQPYASLPLYTSPGGGLVATVADYARFCTMLASGGALDGARVLSPTTVALFGMNHAAPGTMASLQADDGEMAGFGMGLATRVLMDVSKTGRYGTPGEFGWEGAWSTYFWIDPRESLFGIVAAQFNPIDFPLFRRFKQLTYQAMT
jgi:CubicO group peptidase (beta-lactamase class C family)